MDEEPANVAVDKDHVQSTITVGSKVEVMFSNGPAAGSKAKFWDSGKTQKHQTLKCQGIEHWASTLL